MSAVNVSTPESAGQDRNIGEELKAHAVNIKAWIVDFSSNIPDLYVSPPVEFADESQVFVTFNKHKDGTADYFVTKTEMTDEGEEKIIYKWPEEQPERAALQVRTTINKNNFPARSDHKGFKEEDLDKIDEWIALAREGAFSG